MLAFLVKSYPGMPENFVLQEIIELQKNPFEMNVFSMQKPTTETIHRPFNSITVDVNYLSIENGWQWVVIKTHFIFIFKRPWSYLSTLKFSLTRPEGGTLRQFCQAVYFSGLVKKKGIQHIHTHFASETSGLVELVSQLCRVSYSITTHDNDIYLQKPSILQRKISQAQFVVTCTDSNLRFLQSINQSETSIYRVQHDFDCTKVSAENTQTLTQPKKLRILSMGRLHEKKGFPTLISTCHLLVQAGYKFHCDIVGHGSNKEDLEALIQHYQLKNIVRLLGKSEHNDLVALSQKTAILKFPGQVANANDTYPSALMEAICFGIPIISTDISGVPALIENNKAGLVTEVKNYHAFFTPLPHLLGNSRRLIQSEETGEKGVTTHCVAEQHKDHLKELLTHALQQKYDSHFIA